MDVLITVAPKDFNKLKYNYESIIQNVDRIDEFVYISPIPIPAKYLPRKMCLHGQILKSVILISIA